MQVLVRCLVSYHLKRQQELSYSGIVSYRNVQLPIACVRQIQFRSLQQFVLALRTVRPGGRGWSLIISVRNQREVDGRFKLDVLRVAILNHDAEAVRAGRNISRLGENGKSEWPGLAVETENLTVVIPSIR